MPTADLTYAEVGVTRLDEEVWAAGPRRVESRVHLGRGEECWSASADAVMRWAVKTRSGFRVMGEPVATLGVDYDLLFRCAGLSVREPVRGGGAGAGGRRRCLRSGHAARFRLRHAGRPPRLRRGGFHRPTGRER